MLSAPNAIPLAPSPLSPNSSAAPPPRKIFFPLSSPPSKPTPPSAKSPTPSAASSVNTTNPSSSDRSFDHRHLYPPVPARHPCTDRPALRLDQGTGCHRACAVVFFRESIVGGRNSIRPPESYA